MARKIRFPLEMDNGVEVRSIQELRENFSVLKVLDYLKSGKLLTWLRDRYLNEEADAVQEMDIEDPECPEKLCAIFDVPYDKSMEEELKEESCRQERISRLKQYTDKEEYETLIDQVAFDQNELYDLLDEGITEIYLCGERFSIPLSQPGITYIGINKPEAVIDSKKVVDWKKKKITVKNVWFDFRYQLILKEKQEKDKVEAAEELMLCRNKNFLYKWNDILEKFEFFYEFQNQDMYLRRIAKDESKIYFMRKKNMYTEKCEIVSMDLADKSIIPLFDLNYKERFDIVGIRNENLFLRGQYPNGYKMLKFNIKKQEEQKLILDEYAQDILIDKSGENIYMQMSHGLWKYELKSEKKYLISKLRNVQAVDLINDRLLAWGNDPSKSVSEEYYYFVYNTENGKKEIYQGGSELSTQALWRNENKEYRLGTVEYISNHSLFDKYPLYETDLSNGQTAAVCMLSIPSIMSKFIGRKIRCRKGYLYITSSEDDGDGNGKGIGYEINTIPDYRIRLSDYQIQKYNGSTYTI